MLKAQSDEISSLRTTIEKLQGYNIISKLQSESTSLPNCQQAPSNKSTTILPSNTNLPNSSSNSNTPDTTPSSNGDTGSTNISNGSYASSKNTSQVDRKSNIVVSGMEECPKGTSRLDRFKQDINNVANLIQVFDPNFHKQSIHDCFRLGKFKKVLLDHDPFYSNKSNNPISVS